MGLMGAALLALAALVSGSLLGWLINSKIRQGRLNISRVAVQKIIADAQEEAQALKRTAILEAKDEWRRVSDPLEKEIETSKRSLRDLEAKLLEREHQIDRKVDILESKERSLIKTEQDMEGREESIKSAKAEADAMVRQQHQRLESLANMSQAEARKMLIDQQEESARQFAARKVKELKDDAIANGNRYAKEVISRAIERFAVGLAVESTVSVVNIPSDDTKGRIIGRDGRNIRSFEMVTGVEVIVDDTPGIVMLSGFDPLRREVAKNTLEKLILDGRIHPGRIEEVYEKARGDIEELIRESGSKAAFDLGIHDLSESLLELLGQLRFRTSYGQNLLVHSKEVGFLAGMMAEELDLDVALARRAGLLHDISKAANHDVGSDPTQTSAALVRKSGENAEVIEVIETHNQNMPSRSPIATLVEAANQISIKRPGAQKDKVEEYIRRLRNIEEIAMAQPGVQKAYALQNGKEMRVLLDSTLVDDAYADQVADEIADRLERELEQPGQMKVCVIREVRAIHYAR
jgi:ribonuclease Y